MIDIRTLRKRLGMNQTEFASFIGLSDKSVVSRMENGVMEISPRMQMALDDKARILDLEEENKALRRMLKNEIDDQAT